MRPIESLYNCFAAHLAVTVIPGVPRWSLVSLVSPYRKLTCDMDQDCSTRAGLLITRSSPALFLASLCEAH
ncbi:hypothetical protein DPEC_G00283040 [Dallia pectoralis]|uniref:Uncharacterized protein n=1 Tax=Dallia pectoralis TaxID=75939 RepID=A0ACC2FJ05_DALPE|nr:hypothetical protein DPEC_G00283040 [Dallia pectoralis]